MKKLLFGSVVLICFSLAVILFQISCQKNASAQTSTSTQVLDKSLISKSVQTQVGSTTGKDSLGRTITTPIYRYVNVFYTIQNDGSNSTQLNITLPQGLYIGGNGYLSPDGKKIVFVAIDLNNNSSIYSCSIDGSNLKKVIDGPCNLLGTY